MKFYLDIYSKGAYPSDSLSNFAEHNFELDGIPIRCMEGLLQSLKAPSELQNEVCQMDAKSAKAYGSSIRWQDNGGLFHWQGTYFNRFSEDYWLFLIRAYDALAGQNADYAQALLDSGHSLLWHSIGKLRKKDTCLTTWEFVRLLYRERHRLQNRRRSS